MNKMFRLVACAAASAFALTACSDTTTDAQSTPADGGKKIVVMTSFYPIEYLTKRVGGDLVTVETLTPPGADAHHVELSPAKVADLGKADVVIYASGFQPSVDEAIAANPPKTVIDVAPMVQLLPVSEDEDTHDHDHAQSEGHDHDHDHAQPDHDHAHDHSHDGHDHAQSEAHDHDHAQSEGHNHADEHKHEGHDHAHDHGGLDPHFWLDPQRMGHGATAIGQALAKAFPEHAQVFTQNAAAVAKDMNELSAELVSSTKNCKQTSFVTAHKAFGYLADRAGLKQIGMSDVDPESAPSPARLKEVAEFIKAHEIKTVFSEELIDPKVAQTLANDLGLKTATLDPLENQVDPSKDYIAVMKNNIATLHSSLECE